LALADKRPPAYQGTIPIDGAKAGSATSRKTEVLHGKPQPEGKRDAKERKTIAQDRGTALLQLKM
jgi:hypothetical protein